MSPGGLGGERVGWRSWVLNGRGPEGGGPRDSCFFALFRSKVNSFFISLGVFFWNFWWCLTAGTARWSFSGSSCASPDGPKSRRGFTRRPRESKRGCLRAPAFKHHQKFHEKTIKEGKERATFWAVLKNVVLDEKMCWSKSDFFASKSKNKIGLSRTWSKQFLHTVSWTEMSDGDLTSQRIR